MKLKNHKKAQGIQFNWIFIVVLGVVILAFFIGFALRYKDLQDKREDAKLIRSIDNSLNSLNVDNVYTSLNLGGTREVDFDCNTITINDFDQKLKNKIIFSENLNSHELLIWVKEFNFPYKVANLIFISSPNKKYYVVYDTSTEEFVDEFYGEIPKDFNVKKVYSLEGVKLDKNSKVIFLSNYEEISEETEVVRIHLNENKIIFTEGEEVFFDDVLIYAAVFSNYENYKCSFDDLKGKLSSITNIYLKRATYLSTWGACSYDTRNFRSLMNNLEDGEYDKIKQDKENLIFQNEQLVNQGCEAMF